MLSTNYSTQSNITWPSVWQAPYGDERPAESNCIFSAIYGYDEYESEETSNITRVERWHDLSKVNTVMCELDKTLSSGTSALRPSSSETEYLNVIATIRSSIFYEDFLRVSKHKDHIIQQAILSYMSQLDYSIVSANEREYILWCLNNNNTSTQRAAVNTLLSWGDYDNIEELKKIIIPNIYVAEDLAEFIQEKER